MLGAGPSAGPQRPQGQLISVSDCKPADLNEKHGIDGDSTRLGFSSETSILHGNQILIENLGDSESIPEGFNHVQKAESKRENSDC